MFRECVDNGHPHPVQTAGKAVGLVVELAPRMQAREDQLDAAYFFLWVDVDRHSSPIVDYLDGAVFVESHVNLFAVPRDSLIDAVVDNFVCQMVGPRGVGVHARSTAHGLEACKNFDISGVIRLCHYAESLTSCGARGF